MSLYHHENPFSMNVNGEEFGVGYWPGDSRSGMVSYLAQMTLEQRVSRKLMRAVWRKLELARTYLVRRQPVAHREVNLFSLPSHPPLLTYNFSLQRFHQYYGENLQVECPTGSGDVSSSTWTSLGHQLTTHSS